MVQSLQLHKTRDGRVSTDSVEKDFLSRVQNTEGFCKSLSDLSRISGMEIYAFEGVLQSLCKCIWHEADLVLHGEGPVFAAREEVERLKKKLNECNLTAMKQMLATKSGTHSSENLGEDTITFHEPLQYLDKDTKSLVMNIVCDKVRQIENDTAPPSLVQALVQHAQVQMTPEAGASLEELNEMREQLKDARDELRKARLRMEEAEDLSRQFKIKLQTAENRANALEQELGATKTLLATAEAKLLEAEHALRELRAEHAALQVAHTKLQELSEAQKAQIEELGGQLKKERQQNEKLRAEIERLQEYVRRAEQLERELKALQLKFQELETEAEAMRQELARRNNTRTKGTQTNLTGSKIDEQAAETRKLKLMLEELQNKLKEFMQEVRRKYGAGSSSIVEELGLKDLLKEETVFQRLYDDAMERVQRLEKLRMRVRKERKELWPIGGSPRALAADVCERPEVPIFQAIEENQPTASMRKMIEEKQSSQQNASTSVMRAQREQGCGSDAPMDAYFRPPDLQKASPLIMKTSTSLPSLSKAPQNLSMIHLNLEGAARSASKRRHLF